MKRIPQLVLLAVLLGFQLWWGIIPAFTAIDTDFPNYYTSSRLLIEGKDVSRIYDDAWFQSQIDSYGIRQAGKYSPFPPVTSMLMLPAASMSPMTALRVWTCINLLVLVAFIMLLAKTTGLGFLWSAILTLSSGLALANNFRFGQWYLVLSFLILAGYYLWQRGRTGTAGALLGIGAAFKYFPVVFVPLLIMKKQWRALITGGITIASIYLAGTMIYGMDINRQFITTVFGQHLLGNIQDPFTSNFQSWESLLRRMFIFDATLNPLPVFPSTSVFILLLVLVKGAIVAVAVHTIYILEKSRTMDRFIFQFALSALTALLLLPASATYHFLLLILPIALTVTLKPKDWNFRHGITVALYVAIGFLPYRLFRGFDGNGLLTLLAYPRLWLMLALFISVIMMARGVATQPSTRRIPTNE